jgi:hypothetical protein
MLPNPVDSFSGFVAKIIAAKITAKDKNELYGFSVNARPQKKIFPDQDFFCKTRPKLSPTG